MILARQSLLFIRKPGKKLYVNIFIFLLSVFKVWYTLLSWKKWFVLLWTNFVIKIFQVCVYYWSNFEINIDIFRSVFTRELSVREENIFFGFDQTLWSFTNFNVRHQKTFDPANPRNPGWTRYSYQVVYDQWSNHCDRRLPSLCVLH